MSKPESAVLVVVDKIRWQPDVPIAARIEVGNVTGLQAFPLPAAGNAFVSRLYIEAGAEGANAWMDRESVGGGLIPGGYLSLWARTRLGPFRLTGGAAEGGRRNAVFSFGHSF